PLHDLPERDPQHPCARCMGVPASTGSDRPQPHALRLLEHAPRARCRSAAAAARAVSGRDLRARHHSGRGRARPGCRQPPPHPGRQPAGGISRTVLEPPGTTHPALPPDARGVPGRRASEPRLTAPDRGRQARAMAETTILSPVALGPSEAKPLSPGLTSLAGKRLGIRIDRAWHSWRRAADEIGRLARTELGVAEVVVFDPEARIGRPEEESEKVVAFARGV